MKIEVRTIKTGHVMFCNLSNNTNEENRKFISFYRNFKESGQKKYEVITPEHQRNGKD